MNASEALERLVKCSPGAAGWREFEDCCLVLLEYLFVPPLRKPKVQARSLSGTDRRDAVFPNREFNAANPWGQLLQELAARMIVFEFKNYDASEIGKDELDQVRNYLTPTMGRLGVICSNKPPSKVAYIRRNSIYSAEKKVVLFLLPEHFQEMCAIKGRGDEPADLILDLLEEFYLQYE